MQAFAEIKKAARRAKHFATLSSGPHSSLYSPMGNNYARMFYAAGEVTEKERMQLSGNLKAADNLRVKKLREQLEMLHEFARALNGAADKRKVSDDLLLREAFASFLSLLWFDVERL